MKLLIINGPNMNLLGVREPELFGTRTYEELVDFIRSERGEGNELRFDGIIINPGGFAHTSIAIMDAMKAVRTPCVEVHVLEPLLREEYRHHSYAGEAAIATVAGKGFDGYVEAVDILSDFVNK